MTLICARHPGATASATDRGIAIRRVGSRYTFYARGPALYRRLVRTVRGPAVLVENLCKLPFYGPLYSPVPVLALVHHLFGTTAFRQVSFPIATVTWASELGIPWIYRGVPMIAVSPSTRDDLVARGIPAADITIIPNGIDHAHYRPAEGVPGPIVLSLGRVEPYKRIDLVIDAMSRVLTRMPDARLVIVGRGDAVPTLTAQVARLGIGHAVTFRGFVGEDEKVALYQGARVFVNTSEKEGWGLTVLEANACGTPTVASDVPGLRDAVRHDESGLLVPFGDVGATAEALLRILTDDGVWRRLRTGALAWSARYTWDAVADEVEAMVQRLVASFGDRR